MSQSVEQRIRDLEALHNSTTSSYPSVGRRTTDLHRRQVDNIVDSQLEAQHTALHIRQTGAQRTARKQAFAYDGDQHHEYDDDELDSILEYGSEGTNHCSDNITAVRKFASKNSATAVIASLAADLKQDEDASSIHSQNNIIHRWEQHRHEKHHRASENRLTSEIRESESHSSMAAETKADDREVHQSSNIEMEIANIPIHSSWISDFDQSSVDTQRKFQKPRIFRKKYFDEAISRLQCSRQLEEISEHCELKHATEIAGFGSVSEDPMTLILVSDSAFDMFDAELFHNPFREIVTNSLSRSLSNESISPKRPSGQKRRRSKSVPKRPTRSEMERSQQFTSRIAQYLHDVTRAKVNGSFDNASTIESDAMSPRPSRDPSSSGNELQATIQERSGRRSSTILRYVQQLSHTPHNGSFDSSSVDQSGSHLFIETVKLLDQEDDSSIETPKQSNRHRDSNSLSAWSSRKISLSSPTGSGHQIGLFFTGETFEDGEDPHKNPFLERRYATSPRHPRDSMVAPVQQRHSDAILNYLRDFSGVEGSGSFDTGSLVSFASTVVSSSVVSAALMSTPRSDNNPKGLLTEQEISTVKATLLLHRRHNNASKKRSRRRRMSLLSIGQTLPKDKQVGSSAAILNYLKTYLDVHGSGSFDNRSYSTVNTEIGTAIKCQDAVEDHGSVESSSFARRGIQCTESSGAIVDYLRVLNELDTSGSFDTTRASPLGEFSHRNSLSNLESGLPSPDISDRSPSRPTIASGFNESVFTPKLPKNPLHNSSAIFDYLRDFPRAGLNSSFDSASQATELVSLASIETGSAPREIGLQRLPNICEFSDTFEETTDSKSNPFRTAEYGDRAQSFDYERQRPKKCLQQAPINRPRDNSSTILNYLSGLSRVPHSIGSFDSTSETSVRPHVVTSSRDYYRHGRRQKDHASLIGSFDNASQTSVVSHVISSSDNLKHSDKKDHVIMSSMDVSVQQELGMKRDGCRSSHCGSSREEVSSSTEESLCPDQRSGSGLVAKSWRMGASTSEHLTAEKQVPSFDNAITRSAGPIKFQPKQDTSLHKRHRRRSSTGSLQSSPGKRANKRTIFQYPHGLSPLQVGGSFDGGSESYSSSKLEMLKGGEPCKDWQRGSELCHNTTYPHGQDHRIHSSSYKKEYGENGVSCSMNNYGGSSEDVDSLQQGHYCVPDFPPNVDQSTAYWKKPSSPDRNTNRKQGNVDKPQIVQDPVSFDNPGSYHINEGHSEREATDPMFWRRDSKYCGGSGCLPERLTNLDRTAEKDMVTWEDLSGTSRDTNRKDGNIDTAPTVQNSGNLNSSVRNHNIAHTESDVTDPTFLLEESTEYDRSSDGEWLPQGHCLPDCESDIDRTWTTPPGRNRDFDRKESTLDKLQDQSLVTSSANDHNNEKIVLTESEVTDPTFFLGESDDGNESDFSDLPCFPSSSTAEANGPEEDARIAVSNGTGHNGNCGMESGEFSISAPQSGQGQSSEISDPKMNQVIGGSEFADDGLTYKEGGEDSRATNGNSSGQTEVPESRRSKSIGSTKQHQVDVEQEERVSYLRREKRRVEASVRRLSMSRERDSSADSASSDNQHTPRPRNNSLFSTSPEKKARIELHLSELEEVFRKVRGKGKALERKDISEQDNQISQVSHELSTTLSSTAKGAPTEKTLSQKEAATTGATIHLSPRQIQSAPCLQSIGSGNFIPKAVCPKPQAKVCVSTVESCESLNDQEENKHLSSSTLCDDSSSLDESAFGKAMDYNSPAEHPTVPIQVTWNCSIPSLRPVSTMLLESPRSEEAEYLFLEPSCNQEMIDTGLGASRDDSDSPPTDVESARSLKVFSPFMFIDGTTSNSPIFMVKSSKGSESPNRCLPHESHGTYKEFAHLRETLLCPDLDQKQVGEQDRSIATASSVHGSYSPSIAHTSNSFSSYPEVLSASTELQPTRDTEKQIANEESQDPLLSFSTLKILWEQQTGSPTSGFDNQSLHNGKSQPEFSPAIPFKRRHNQTREKYNKNTGKEDLELAVGNGARTNALPLQNWPTREVSSEELTRHSVNSVSGPVRSHNRSGVESDAIPPSSVIAPVSCREGSNRRKTLAKSSIDCVPKRHLTELCSFSENDANASHRIKVNNNTEAQGIHRDRAARISTKVELRGDYVSAPSDREVNVVSRLEHLEFWKAHEDASTPSPMPMKRNPSVEELCHHSTSIQEENGEVRELVGTKDSAIHQFERDDIASENCKVAIDTNIASQGSEMCDLSPDTSPPKLTAFRRGVHKRPKDIASKSKTSIKANSSVARVNKYYSIDVFREDDTSLEKPQRVTEKQSGQVFKHGLSDDAPTVAIGGQSSKPGVDQEYHTGQRKNEVVIEPKIDSKNTPQHCTPQPEDSLPLSRSKVLAKKTQTVTKKQSGQGFKGGLSKGDSKGSATSLEKTQIVAKKQSGHRFKERLSKGESTVRIDGKSLKPRIDQEYLASQRQNEVAVTHDTDSDITTEDCTPQSEDSLPLYQSDLFEQIGAKARDVESIPEDKRAEVCPIGVGFAQQESQTSAACVQSSCTRRENQRQSPTATASRRSRFREDLNVKPRHVSDPVHDPMLACFESAQRTNRAQTHRQHRAVHIYQHGSDQVEHPDVIAKPCAKAAPADKNVAQNRGGANESPITASVSVHISKLNRIGNKFSRQSAREKADPSPVSTISSFGNLSTKAPPTIDTEYLVNSIGSTKPTGDQLNPGMQRTDPKLSPLTSMGTNARCAPKQRRCIDDTNTVAAEKRNSFAPFLDREWNPLESSDERDVDENNAPFRDHSLNILPLMDGIHSDDIKEAVSTTRTSDFVQVPKTSAFVRRYQQVAKHLVHTAEPPPSESTSNRKYVENPNVSGEPPSLKPIDSLLSNIKIPTARRESNMVSGKHPIPPDELCFLASSAKESVKEELGQANTQVPCSSESTDSKQALAGASGPWQGRESTAKGCTTQPPNQRPRVFATKRKPSLFSAEAGRGLLDHSTGKATHDELHTAYDVAHDRALYERAAGMNLSNKSVHVGIVRGCKSPQNMNPSRQDDITLVSSQPGLKKSPIALNTSPQLCGLPRRSTLSIFGENLARKDCDIPNPAPAPDEVNYRPTGCRDETEESSRNIIPDEPICHGAADIAGGVFRLPVEIDQLESSKQSRDKNQTEAGHETMKPGGKQSMETRGVFGGRSWKDTNEPPPTLSLDEPTNGHDNLAQRFAQHNTEETIADHVGEQANPFSVAKPRVAREKAAWNQPNKVSTPTGASEPDVRSKKKGSYAPASGLSFLSPEQTSKVEAEGTSEPTAQTQNVKGSNSVVSDDYGKLNCDDLSSVFGITTSSNTGTATSNVELDPLLKLETNNFSTCQKSDRELNPSTSQFSLDSICNAMCDRDNAIFGTDHVILNSENRADWPKVAVPNGPLTRTSLGECFEDSNCLSQVTTAAWKYGRNVEPSLSSQEKRRGKRGSTNECEETIMIVPEVSSYPETPSSSQNFFEGQKAECDLDRYPVVDTAIDQSSVGLCPHAQLPAPSVLEETSSLPPPQPSDIDMPPVESSFSVSDSFSAEGKKRALWAKVVQEFKEKIAEEWHFNNEMEVAHSTEAAFPDQANQIASRNKHEDMESENDSVVFSDIESAGSDAAICPHRSSDETVRNAIFLSRFQASNTLENTADLRPFNGNGKHGNQRFEPFVPSPSDRTILALQQDQITYSYEERQEVQEDNDRSPSTVATRQLSPSYYSSEEDSTSCGLSASASSSSSSSSSYLLSSSGSEISTTTEDYEAHCRDPPSMTSSQSTESGHSKTDPPASSALPILPPLPARSTRSPNESYPMIRRGSFDDVVVLPEIGSPGLDPPVYSPPGYSRQLPTPFHDTLLESMSPLLSVDSNDDENLHFEEEKPEDQQPGCAQAFCGGIDFLQDKLCGMCNF